MAKLKNGIFSALRGTVGSMVFYEMNGVNVVRRRPKKRKRYKPHPNHLPQQAKFLLCTRLLQPLTGLFRLTYARLAVGMTAFNKAFSYHMNEAVSGTYPNLSIDFNMVRLSQGNLPNPSSANCGSVMAGQVEWHWKRKCRRTLARQNDKAFVAVYCESLGQWIYSLDAASRSEGHAVLDVSSFSGQSVHSWLGFISADGKWVSESLYLGVVNVM